MRSMTIKNYFDHQNNFIVFDKTAEIGIVLAYSQINLASGRYRVFLNQFTKENTIM
jgi:hypothetical protein